MFEEDREGISRVWRKWYTAEIHGLNSLSDIARKLLVGHAIQVFDIVYRILDRNQNNKKGLELQGLGVRLVVANKARK